MKLYLICDNMDTYTGMRLAGVEGVVVHDKEKLNDAITSAIEDKSIGILLINERLCSENREYIDKLKLTLRQPLLLEIPDRHGTNRAEDYITDYVRDAIGVKL
ncbi:MAG: ATP synthase subunit F [Lachnospiraceae bacterium]|nr:ATP synthase subunit F [Lachnospiraceae bacterium]